ncbi:MAG TPA: PQQ-binding-like beta-propeller repeat protein, partial [Gemmatimonadaceae bacterium]|nr:PQQ-binding-like beta-propeller repeat protein [Gemmatimonadaceae bacterium]
PRLMALGLAVSVSACGDGHAAQPSRDVAMFRGGPTRAGIYAASPGTALAGVQWRFMTDGDVIGSPTVLGQTVYVGSGDGRMYALDRTTGTRKWAFDAGNPIPSTPAVGGGAVFFGTRDGHFFAVDAATGKQRWKFATGPLKGWAWGHESGDVYTSSPAFVGGVVYFGAGDGRVYAVDATSGKEKWHAQTEGRVRASPAIDGSHVYIGSADGRVYAFDRTTGAQKWRFETEGVNLFSGNFGYDRRTVQSSPAVVNGTVYEGARDGWIYAIDAATGNERWRYDHKISWINTSPAVLDGVVYDGSSDGQFVQALDAASGKELWRTTTGTTWSSPAVAGDVIYSGDGQGRLHAMDRKTGKLLWSFRTGASVHSSPTPTGDLVIVGSADAGVYAVRVTPTPVHRAVFYDSTYIKSASTPDPSLMSRYFANRGYEVLDEKALGAFLDARIADKAPSVLVFAVDHLTPNVVDTAAFERSAVRRYLDAGGKVVWPGIPPALFPRDPKTGNPGGLAALRWGNATKLLGVPHEAAMFDQRGSRATVAGTQWGLPPRWRSAWGIEPDKLITVLGTDEFGLATAWVRRYSGPEGTGFVRVPADDNMTVFLAAEYRPSR